MDTFIDKIAQRRNAQEMILANMTAEAAKMEQMQNQMKAYDELMQEIRRVNLKTAENLSDVQGTLQEYMAKFEAMQADQSKDREMQQQLAQMRELLTDNSKDEEVQQQLAQMRELLTDNSKDEEMQQQLAQLRELLADNSKDEEMQQTLAQMRELLADNSESEENKQAMAQLRENLEEKFKASDDFLHRENVKVYRNVQAAMTEELNKQTEELKKSQQENRGSRAVLPISIAILIAVAADIIIQLFGITIVF